MEHVEVTPALHIPLSELSFKTSRSGGPGGQNVNKRETRVELVWDLATSEALTEAQRARLQLKLASKLDTRGRLRIVSSEERSQAMNRERAIERFRELLAEALKIRRPRRPTKPSKAATERRITAKRVRSSLKRQRERPDVES